MTPLVIIGAGDLGRETVALVKRINTHRARWRLRGLLDSDSSRHGTSVLGHPVLGPPSWLSRHPRVAYVIAIGEGSARKRVADQLASHPAAAATLVDPSVSVHESIRFAPGCIVYAGVVCMVAVTAYRHVIVDAHCTLGHDAVLHPFATLHPGVRVSGRVTIGNRARLGAGAVVLPNRRVSEGATVGAGAVVTRNVPAHTTVVGVPARAHL